MVGSGGEMVAQQSLTASETMGRGRRRAWGLLRKVVRVLHVLQMTLLI